MYNYAEYDVPKNLVFRTKDLVRMNGLRCGLKLATENFENILSAPDKILKAEVNLNFSLAQKDILVQGAVDGVSRLRCGRCLEPFETEFHEEFVETFPIRSEIIDIMNEVSRALALIENIAPVCKEGCKGLCDVCGKNKNAGDCGCVREKHSPFAALKNFKK